MDTALSIPGIGCLPLHDSGGAVRWKPYTILSWSLFRALLPLSGPTPSDGQTTPTNPGTPRRKKIQCAKIEAETDPPPQNRRR